MAMTAEPQIALADGLSLFANDFVAESWRRELFGQNVPSTRTVGCHQNMKHK